MAIAFDSTSMGSTSSWLSGNNIQTWSHTCSGSDRYLLVYTLNTFQSTTVNSITYNGVSMTKIGETILNGFRHTVWGLVAPATGTYTVTVTFSSTTTGNVFLAASSYTGVNQTTPNDTTVLNYIMGGSSGSVIATVTGANEWVVGATTYASSVGDDTYTNATKRGVINSAQGGRTWDSNGTVSSGNYTVTASGSSQDRMMIAVSLYSAVSANTSAFFPFF